MLAHRLQWTYEENATGYFLTRALMYWFWDLYCAPADRTDPRVSPLRGKVSGLPPAFVATCEFDPLRDEGIAYAAALKSAGIPVKQHAGEGLIHGYFGLGDASEVANAEATRARADFKVLLNRTA